MPATAATPECWRREPLPAARAPLPLRLRRSDADVRQLRDGFIAGRRRDGH